MTTSVSSLTARADHEADARQQLLFRRDVQARNRIEGVEDPARLAAVLVAEASTDASATIRLSSEARRKIS